MNDVGVTNGDMSDWNTYIQYQDLFCSAESILFKILT